MKKDHTVLLVFLSVAIVWMIHNPIKTLVIIGLMLWIGSCGTVDPKQHAANIKVAQGGMTSELTSIEAGVSDDAQTNPYDSDALYDGGLIRSTGSIVIENHSDKKVTSLVVKCPSLKSQTPLGVVDTSGIDPHSRVLHKFIVPAAMVDMGAYNTKCVVSGVEIEES